MKHSPLVSILENVITAQAFKAEAITTDCAQEFLTATIELRAAIELMLNTHNPRKDPTLSAITFNLSIIAHAITTIETYPQTPALTDALAQYSGATKELAAGVTLSNSCPQSI